ncbi:COMM domain-containing protein 9-like [Tubulanus polymorphus]|uniref:COMM domain-containing protein 9-like n=1 Tax=Tubulanus polymorphus TaxID=672921 RepID=UPI003DA5A9D6
MEDVEFSHLNFLLKANSKDVVVQLCHEVFNHRHEKNFVKQVIVKCSNDFGVSQLEAKQLLTSLRSVVKRAVFIGSSEPRAILAIFPSDFHKNLRDLLAKIFLENMQNWRNAAVNNLVSMPKLIDFDWRVDLKTSTDSISRMSVPTCILQMQVQDAPSKRNEVPDTSCLNVELSKETLDTMLDGLSKIRDQLSSVAGK